MGKVETFNQQSPPRLQQQPPPPPPPPTPPSQQQQQLTMPLVANCATTPNKRIKYDREKSTNEKTDVKWAVKRKINKKEQKKRLNARIRRLVCPKSPSMVFYELFNNVPIHIKENSFHNVMRYTATLEIDGQMYSGNHISKTQAKQKACENFLSIMLAKKISEQSEESPMNVEMEVGENGSISKAKGPPKEDFPWTHFASLAMHNLIDQWKLQPVVTRANYVQKESTVIKPQPKISIPQILLKLKKNAADIISRIKNEYFLQKIKCKLSKK